eukprot:6204900-Pleurochrysis_carterae.AAC.4
MPCSAACAASVACALGPMRRGGTLMIRSRPTRSPRCTTERYASASRTSLRARKESPRFTNGMPFWTSPASSAKLCRWLLRPPRARSGKTECRRACARTRGTQDNPTGRSSATSLQTEAARHKGDDAGTPKATPPTPQEASACLRVLARACTAKGRASSEAVTLKRKGTGAE